MIKPPDSPPSWYSDFKVPNNMLTTFQPLIYLIGLDVHNNPTHRSFWEVLSIKNTGRDFQPKYVNVPLDHKFREKKNKSPEMAEYYIPRGILKTNWVHKHMEEIPSAVVTFFDMNWSDPQWNERKLELTRQIKLVKSNLSAHGTQLLVMLMKPAGNLDDNFTTDRASAFCAAAEVPPKYLFVLAHTNLDRIQACVQRLEIGMREISKGYYSSRIKKVKGWKDKVTVTPLLVRYNFKIGVYQEIRKDSIASLNHYQSAFEALLTIKATDPNVQELKMVAAVINYRICRIHLSKGEGKEARSHFEKHIRSFLKLEGNKELRFEHFAWLSQQYYQFGDLLKQYYRIGGLNIPDPVSYFISAGRYMEQRRSAFLESVHPSGKCVWPSEMNPYNGSVPVKLHSIGQRPWWNNPFSQDYLYALEDGNTILALTYFESLIKHSDHIISDWGIASEVCRENQRRRCRCQLMSMMGGEFLRTGEYSKCIMLMTHVLREFGLEDWKNIVFDVASCGLSAASSAPDIPAYCNFLLILLKRDIRNLVTPGKQDLLWDNFQSVLRGTLPVSLDSNIINTPAWEKALGESTWTSYVEIHSQSILDCKASFVDEVTSVRENPKIRFILTNMSEHVLSLQSYGVRMIPVDYNCETKINLRIHPQETVELELSFKPLIRDISKQIQLQVAYVDIGEGSRSVLLHYSSMGISNLDLWSNEVRKSKEGGGSSSIRIEQSKPLITITTNSLEPLLVNEWYKLSARITNTDNRNYEKIGVSCQLQTSDAQNSFLSSEPSPMVPPTNLIHVAELPKLEVGQSTELVVYVKTQVLPVSEFKVFYKIKYTDHYGQLLSPEHLVELKVIFPFEVRQDVTQLQNVGLDSVSPNEEFMLRAVIRNTCTQKLRVGNCTSCISSPSVEVKEEVGKSGSGDSILNPDEETTYLIMLSSSQENTISPGYIQVSWKRESEGVDGMYISRIPIEPIPSHGESPLLLKATFSNNGHGRVKEPMVGLYTLFNRSNTLFDLTILMESTESFMNAGPKRLSVKLFGREKYSFKYILFPLVTGLVDTPKLTFSTPPNGTTLLEPKELSINQNSPKTLYITA